MTLQITRHMQLTMNVYDWWLVSIPLHRWCSPPRVESLHLAGVSVYSDVTYYPSSTHHVGYILKSSNCGFRLLLNALLFAYWPQLYWEEFAQNSWYFSKVGLSMYICRGQLNKIIDSQGDKFVEAIFLKINFLETWQTYLNKKCECFSRNFHF